MTPPPIFGAKQEAMKWTQDKPTKDGYYWLRRDNIEPEVMEIHNGMACEADVSFELEDDRYESALWFGPLTPPPLDAPTGCRRNLAPGQWWNFCGETDMGQTLPFLCTECGGKGILAEPDAAAVSKELAP